MLVYHTAPFTTQASKIILIQKIYIYILIIREQWEKEANVETNFGSELIK